MNAPGPNRPAGKEGQLHPRWQSITVRPWSLMKLTAYINPLFPAGTIVALSNELIEDYSTPTKHQGQGPPNLNASTRVRIYRWHKETTITPFHSRDGGKPFSIQHKHLVDPVSTTPRLGSRGWDLEKLVRIIVPPTDGDVTYMTDRYPTEGSGRPGRQLVIPNGTVGKVTKCMTGTNRVRTEGQQVSSTRTDWWYVLDLDVRQTQWCWVQCQEWVAVSFLELASAEEVQQTEDRIRRTTGRNADPEVVSKPIQNRQ